MQSGSLGEGLPRAAEHQTQLLGSACEEGSPFGQPAAAVRLDEDLLRISDQMVDEAVDLLSPTMSELIGGLAAAGFVQQE